ncbi:MAG: glycosyltransferase [Candidatus Heimdallarchaeota archaeon]
MVKVDVVVPAYNSERTLGKCLSAIRECMEVNNLIVVYSESKDNTLEIAKSYSDIVLTVPKGNIGLARAVGLQEVKTPYYASVDSDVAVNREWNEWCIKTIQQKDVAACQGFAKPIARIYGSLYEKFLFEGRGLRGRGFLCLGNTMLKTKIIKRVGMPRLHVGEDWELRKRIQKIGYKWISNIKIKTTHLKTDIDVIKIILGEMKSLGELKEFLTH